MDYRLAPFEVKVASTGARVIEGYCACWTAPDGGPDRVGDIIDQKAFTRSLASKDVRSISVLVGHDLSRLPVGVPQEIRPDNRGLFCSTKVAPTTDGDNLLELARFLKANGQTLGMSIGYTTLNSKYGTVEGKSVRILTECDLVEYSFAPASAIANPGALVSDVKTRRISPANVRAMVEAGRLSIAEAREIVEQARRDLGREQLDAYARIFDRAAYR
jgi:HK97 family phage prohead protease